MSPWLIGSLFLLALLGTGLLLWKGLQRAEETDRLVTRLGIRLSLSCLLCVLIGSLLVVLQRASAGSLVAGFGLASVTAGAAAVLGILLGLIWAPEIGAIISRPFTTLFLGSNEAPVPEPDYSLAETRRKQGRYAEAMAMIQEQLALFPNDARGWFLLAEIKLENFHDFDGATAVLQEFLSQPTSSPQMIVTARLRLADWQVKYHRDFEAARESLRTVVEQYPDLPQSQVAYQRLAHLDELAGFSADHARAVPLGVLADLRLGLRPSTAEGVPTTGIPKVDISALLEHLEKFPLDREVREQVALHYGRDEHRPDLCAEHLERLISCPGVRPHEVARWLHWLADIYVKEAHDEHRARAALTRLAEMFPNSTIAAQARRRMETLQREVHAAEAARTVRLGTYPQYLGLDGRPPLS